MDKASRISYGSDVAVCSISLRVSLIYECKEVWVLSISAIPFAKSTLKLIFDIPEMVGDSVRWDVRDVARVSSDVMSCVRGLTTRNEIWESEEVMNSLRRLDRWVAVLSR